MVDTKKVSTIIFYAKEKNINYKYGGFLSNGVRWEVRYMDILISGDATSIPGFDPGQAPWVPYTKDVMAIVVEMPNLKRIGQYAFYGMKGITTVKLHTENSIHFGKYAFFGFSDGINLYFDGDSASWQKWTIDYGNDAIKQAWVRCTKDNHTYKPKHVPEHSEELTAETFTEEHIRVAKDLIDPRYIKEAGFDYNAVFKGDVLAAIKTWDVIGDIGKAISFQFFSKGTKKPN